MDGMGWDGSPGGPRYRAPTVLITITSQQRTSSEFRQFSPKVAAEVAAPLSQAKKITMVSKKSQDYGLKR